MTNKKTAEEPTAREKRLEKALQVAIPVIAFYMNPETYFAVGFGFDPPCGDFRKDFDKTDLGMKPGKKARKAFDKISRILEVLEEPK